MDIRSEEIKKLIEKKKDLIDQAEKGKIEINFCGSKITSSITIIEESKN